MVRWLWIVGLLGCGNDEGAEPPLDCVEEAGVPELCMDAADRLCDCDCDSPHCQPAEDELHQRHLDAIRCDRARWLSLHELDGVDFDRYDDGMECQEVIEASCDEILSRLRFCQSSD